MAFPVNIVVVILTQLIPFVDKVHDPFNLKVLPVVTTVPKVYSKVFPTVPP